MGATNPHGLLRKRVTKISDRLSACNLRIIRTDGSIERVSEFDGSPTRLQVAYMCSNDDTIADFQYSYNSNWKSV